MNCDDVNNNRWIDSNQNEGYMAISRLIFISTNKNEIFLYSYWTEWFGIGWIQETIVNYQCSKNAKCWS